MLSDYKNKELNKYRNKQKNKYLYITYIIVTNLALKKPAYQSTTWNEATADG